MGFDPSPSPLQHELFPFQLPGDCFCLFSREYRDILSTKLINNNNSIDNNNNNDNKAVVGDIIIGVQFGISKGIEDVRRPPA
jgi:hypothetical protein